MGNQALKEKEENMGKNVLRWVALPFAVVIGAFLLSAIFTLLCNLGSPLYGGEKLGYPTDGGVVSIIDIILTLGRDVATGFAATAISFAVAPTHKKTTAVVTATAVACFGVVSIILNFINGGSLWLLVGTILTMAGAVIGAVEARKGTLGDLEYY